MSARGYDDVAVFGFPMKTIGPAIVFDAGCKNNVRATMGNISTPSCAGGHGGPPLRRGFLSITTTCIQSGHPTVTGIRTISTLVSRSSGTRTNSVDRCKAVSARGKRSRLERNSHPPLNNLQIVPVWQHRKRCVWLRLVPERRARDVILER